MLKLKRAEVYNIRFSLVEGQPIFIEDNPYFQNFIFRELLFL